MKPGDRIILCRRNRPVAEIRPISGHQNGPRPDGLGQGLADLSETFFDPLPDDILDDFKGGSG